VRSFGLVEKLPQRKLSRGKTKPAYFNGRALYRREELGAGAKLQTPCIVTEYSGTTLIDADAKARIDPFGNLIIDL
jgi:N-methylhydantoinase A/oxoprolinase/acetone carboxylase beta subunit